MRHYCSNEALCPFYKYEDDQLIYCEGVQNGCSIRLSFAYARDSLKYKMDYCRKDYEKCRVARMLNEKYNEAFEREKQV